MSVLNLIINGLPSKQYEKIQCFQESRSRVLNLIINGLPSKLKNKVEYDYAGRIVLNLIINGLPSKLYR